MSKTYYIPIHILAGILDVDTSKTSCKLKMSFELMEILAGSRMQELLRSKLLQSGWEEEGNQVKKNVGNIEWVIDPTGGTISVKADASQVTIGIYAGNDKYPDTEYLKNNSHLAKLIEKTLADTEKEQKEILVKHIIEVRKTLNVTLKDVYREALLEKAASMGNVISTSETSENGELRIRIELT